MKLSKRLVCPFLPLLVVGVSCSDYGAEHDVDGDAAQMVAAARLKQVGDNGLPADKFPLGLCEGDCDDDDECASGLKCFQRNKKEKVPGCSESGLSGKDYCYKDTDDNHHECSSESQSTVMLGVQRVRTVFPEVIDGIASDPDFPSHFGNSSSRESARNKYKRLQTFYKNVGPSNFMCMDRGAAQATVGGILEGAPIVIGPEFFTMDGLYQANALVHEAAHHVLSATHGQPEGNKGLNNAYSYGNFFATAVRKAVPDSSSW